MENTLKSRLKERAILLRSLREYLNQHDCMEVTSPTLRPYGVTDPFITSVDVYLQDEHLGYLQTSPECAMKRLLSMGSGDIWQLGPVFRGGESGRIHHTEFTMLEWYRCGWSLTDLMEEVVELARAGSRSVVASGAPEPFGPSPEHKTYRALFEDRFGTNPHRLDVDDLIELCRSQLGSLSQHIPTSTGRSGYLDALFSQLVEPGLIRPTFVTEFPIEQAALASETERGGDRVSLRFELYCNGIELANGYDELADSTVLQARFEDNNRVRNAVGLREMPLDVEFLSIIDRLPDCVGVAMGIDRLHLVLAGGHTLDEFDN